LQVPKDPDPRSIEPGMRVQHLVSSPSVRVGYLQTPKCPNAIWEPRKPIDPIMHAVTPAFDATRRKAPRSRSFSNPCYSWSHQPSQILLQGSTVATQHGSAAIFPGFGAGSTGTSSSPPILGSFELAMCHEPRDHGDQRSFHSTLGRRKIHTGTPHSYVDHKHCSQVGFMERSHCTRGRRPALNGFSGDIASSSCQRGPVGQEMVWRLRSRNAPLDIMKLASWP
jgi:hypothetical protein